MGQDLIAQPQVPEERQHRRRSEDSFVDLLSQHMQDDRKNFEDLMEEIRDTKRLIREVKVSVSGAVSLFNHSKWLVKVLAALGGLITFGVTLWYMLAAIKAGQPPT